MSPKPANRTLTVMGLRTAAAVRMAGVEIEAVAVDVPEAVVGVDADAADAMVDAAAMVAGTAAVEAEAGTSFLRRDSRGRNIIREATTRVVAFSLLPCPRLCSRPGLMWLRRSKTPRLARGSVQSANARQTQDPLF